MESSHTSGERDESIERETDGYDTDGYASSLEAHDSRENESGHFRVRTNELARKSYCQRIY